MKRASFIALGVLAAIVAAGSALWKSHVPAGHAEGLLEAMSSEDWKGAVEHLSWSGIPETAAHEGIGNRYAWGRFWQRTVERPSRFKDSRPDQEYAVTGRDGQVRTFRFEFVDDGRVNEVWIGARKAFQSDFPSSPASDLPAELPPQPVEK